MSAVLLIEASFSVYQNMCSSYVDVCIKFVRFVLSLSSTVVQSWGGSPFLSSFFYCKLLFSGFLLLLSHCPVYNILGCHRACLEWLWHWKSQHLEMATALGQTTVDEDGWSRRKPWVTSAPSWCSTYPLPGPLHPE